MGEREGLSREEAQKRLKQYGLNEIAAKQVKWWTLMARQFKSPLVYLLVGAVAVEAGLGEFVEGGVILGIVFVNALLGFFQEFRSEQALKMLKKFITVKSTVIREGREMLIETKRIVPGDILVCSPGNILAADVRWLETEGLKMDESVMSGESQGVEKSANSRGFAGTTVSRGKGWGVVTATGGRTAWGKVAKETVETQQTSSFEKDIGKFSKFVLYGRFKKHINCCGKTDKRP
ncbi:hypothetical protein HYS82_01290 [Candidatus Amesbacteria bacterium]|nr:hypothetical protein [Candidatus Amesbacteria bacterium]